VHQRRRTGSQVLWNGYTGTFLRDPIEGRTEVLIGTQTYRVPRNELRPA
jgi:hypothetical protein